MILDALPGLQLGALDLMGYDKTGPYFFQALSDDASFGNPTAIVREITSFLMDGGIEVTEGYGNRELTFRVAVWGEDSYALAAGEAALRAEVAKRNVLVFTPPNAVTHSGEPCVFDVVNSDLDYNFGDILELSLLRIYVLTIKALPFARAADPVLFSSAAPPSGTPVATLVDACSVTTGWAATSSSGTPTVTQPTGKIQARQGFVKSTSQRWLKLSRTGLAQSMTGTPYVRLNFTTFTDLGGDPKSLSTVVIINGVIVPEIARDGNYVWFTHPGGTLTSIVIQVYGKFPTATGNLYILIDDVTRTDSTTSQTTSGLRQQFQSVPVGGSQRTQGNLVLADETPTALGTVLVYTTPIDSPAAQPPLRRLRSAGPSETTDTSLVSQKYSDLTVLHTFDIPAPNVPPGGYLLLARIKATSGTNYGVTWSGESVMGSTSLDVGGPHGVTGGTLLATNAWQIVTVGYMSLPTFNMGSTGKVRVGLQATANILLDEAWLFNTDAGRLTWVEAGTGTPAAGGSANRVFIDAASLASPVPSVQLGFASDRSDAFGAGAVMKSFGEHEFTPPMTNVFVVTTNSVATSVSMSHYPRFHTHVTA